MKIVNKTILKLLKFFQKFLNFNFIKKYFNQVRKNKHNHFVIKKLLTKVFKLSFYKKIIIKLKNENNHFLIYKIIIKNFKLYFIKILLSSKINENNRFLI